MIMEFVGSTAVAAVLLLGGVAVIIANGERDDPEPPPDDDPEPQPQNATDPLTVEFTALRAALFTDEGDAFAAHYTPPVRSKHHHDTVEFVALDYLIPNAFAARIGPRLKYPVAA